MIRIDWTNLARDMLADIWVASPLQNRVFIERAVLGFERDLAVDPLDVGESRGSGNRVEIRPPLTF